MAGVGAQWKRFLRSMEQGEYYDAEQALQSAYRRELAGAQHGKGGTSKAHALEMLDEGCSMLIGHSQLGSVAVLMPLVVKHDAGDGQEHGGSLESAMRMLRSMYAVWEAQANASLQLSADAPREESEAMSQLSEMSKALQKTLELVLAATIDQHRPEYHRELCEQMATVKWRLHRFGDSQAYFLKSASSADLARMVWDWCMACKVRSERPLIVARCFLLILTHSSVFGNDMDRTVARARSFSECIQSMVAGPDNGTTDHGSVMARQEPLLHFIEFVGEAAMRERAELFQLARSVYQPSLCRDPALDKLLDKIAVHVFHIQPAAPAPPPNMLGSLMGDMMRGMFAGPQR